VKIQKGLYVRKKYKAKGVTVNHHKIVKYIRNKKKEKVE